MVLKQIHRFRLQYTDFFLTFHALKTRFELSGQSYIEIIEGKQKLLRVSQRFESLRVRVTEGKITVHV